MKWSVQNTIHFTAQSKNLISVKEVNTLLGSILAIYRVNVNLIKCPGDVAYMVK
jgi:hypothetical protein